MMGLLRFGIKVLVTMRIARMEAMEFTGLASAGHGGERLTRCVAPATGLLYTCVLRWLS